MPSSFKGRRIAISRIPHPIRSRRFLLLRVTCGPPWSRLSEPSLKLCIFDVLKDCSFFVDEGSATEVHWLNRPENDFFSRDRFLKIIHPVRKVRHVPQFPSTDVGSIGFSFFLKPDVLKTPGMNSSVGHPAFSDSTQNSPSTGSVVKTPNMIEFVHCCSPSRFTRPRVDTRGQAGLILCVHRLNQMNAESLNLKNLLFLCFKHDGQRLCVVALSQVSKGSKAGTAHQARCTSQGS